MSTHVLHEIINIFEKYAYVVSNGSIITGNYIPGFALVNTVFNCHFEAEPRNLRRSLAALEMTLRMVNNSI